MAASLLPERKVGRWAGGPQRWGISSGLGNFSGETIKEMAALGPTQRQQLEREGEPVCVSGEADGF